jgi:methyl-accepting chemotaxis protein
MDRAAVMELLQSSVDDTVGAAAAGDFSKRVDIEVDDPALANMVRNVNGLIDTVGRGLHETGSVLAALAKQDLTPRVAGEYRGAFLQLKNDTNAVAENLTSVMGGLRSTSSALKVATSEILAGANDLSERTTRQAATIEETSAAMEQLASTVSQNAKRAKDASSNAEQVTRTAEQGGAVMRDANTAMERITDSSAKISNIIGLIDDIAFQTIFWP